MRLLFMFLHLSLTSTVVRHGLKGYESKICFHFPTPSFSTPLRRYSSSSVDQYMFLFLLFFGLACLRLRLDGETAGLECIGGSRSTGKSVSVCKSPLKLNSAITAQTLIGALGKSLQWLYIIPCYTAVQ